MAFSLSSFWQTLNRPVRMPKLFGGGPRPVDQAQAELAKGPPPQVPPWQLNRQTAFTNWEDQRALEEGYNYSYTAAACMDLRSATCAGVPWVVERFVGPDEDDWEVVPRHPLARRLEKPTPFHDRRDLITRTLRHMFLTGKAYWHLNLIQDKQNPIGEIQTLLPSWTSPEKNREEFIKQWWYNAPGYPPIPYPTDQVVWFRFPHPSDPYDGMGLLEAGKVIIDLDRTMSSYIWNSVNNRAVKDGIVFIKRLAGSKSFEEILNSIEEQTQGVDRARGIVAVDADGNFVPTNASAMELDYSNSKVRVERNVCANFRTPPVLIGDMEDSTYNNYNTALIAYLVLTIVPDLELLASAMTRTMCPHYEKNGQELRLVPDLSKSPAFQVLLESQADTAKKYWDMAVPGYEINRRLRLGFPEDMPEWTRGYVPNSVTRSDFAEELAEKSIDAPEPDPNAFNTQEDQAQSTDIPPASSDPLESEKSLSQAAMEVKELVTRLFSSP